MPALAEQAPAELPGLGAIAVDAQRRAVPLPRLDDPAAMTKVVLVATAYPLGPAATGLWCDACLLPSIIQQDFAWSLCRRPMGVIRAWHCTGCGRGGT